MDYTMLLEFLAVGILSFFLAQILTPGIRKIALKVGLVDIPNHRKVHTDPIPLIGGIVVALTMLLAMGIIRQFLKSEIMVVIIASMVLLIVGIVDDKKDLRASYKLIVELCLSYLVAASGIRLHSLHGLFGIEHISIFWQYFLTILLMAGAVNAANLMDGIDGLAGGIALSGFGLLFVLSIMVGDVSIAMISIIMVGSLIHFLRQNFSQKKKIFLGDSGSLFLGFLMICLGIYFLEYKGGEDVSYGALFIIFVFFVPVFDFIRVFIGRIARKGSPFIADKTHLHHYLLLIGLSHKKISVIVFLMNFTILMTAFVIMKYAGISFLLLCLILVVLFYKMISFVKSFYDWKVTIKEIEHQK